MSGLKVLMSHVAVKKFRNAFIVLALLFISIIGRWELKISAEFKILPQDESPVHAGTTGVLTEVIAREGMHVKKGDLLARTRDADKQAVSDTNAGELLQRKSELARLIAGALPLEITEQESKIAAKEAEIEGDRQNLEQRNRLQEVIAQKKSQLDYLKKDATAQ